MPTTRSAALNGQGQRIAIAAARFNAQIVEQLVAGAVDGLIRHGVAADAITVVWCPGSWELALVCKKLAESKKYDAVIACGAVIRGETPHFDYVAGEAAKGLAGVQQATGVPIVFSVLTTDTTDQAWARAGGKAGNKGFDGAMTAVEMVNLLKDL